MVFKLLPNKNLFHCIFLPFSVWEITNIMQIKQENCFASNNFTLVGINYLAIEIWGGVGVRMWHVNKLKSKITFKGIKIRSIPWSTLFVVHILSLCPFIGFSEVCRPFTDDQFNWKNPETATFNILFKHFYVFLSAIIYSSNTKY